jgi:ribosomal VAR1-like protein
MLNLFKLNLIKKIKAISLKVKKSNKHYPSPTREWNNSIYSYNKNTTNLIPSSTLLAIKLIKSYFNLYNYKLDSLTRENKLLNRLRKLSSNKIYISNGEFKHRNDRVIITLYIFNRQMQNYILSIENNYLKLFKINLVNRNKIIELINKKSFDFFKKINHKKHLIIESLNRQIYKNKDIISYKVLSNYVSKHYSKFVKKSLKELYIYLYYKQLLYINESKLKYTYLQFLKKYLIQIYNKDIEFNLVNLRRFYLNSDILSESITLKIKKNRRKLLKYLNILKRKVRISDKKNFYSELGLNKTNLYINEDKLEKIVLKTIKYKHITGFRLETKGRLTRRYTASRSISKLIYKGNLSNIDSSYRGYSSVLLRGNLRSNLQYTKLKSKTRIGSFGIKGWISSN